MRNLVANLMKKWMPKSEPKDEADDVAEMTAAELDAMAGEPTEAPSVVIENCTFEGGQGFVVSDSAPMIEGHALDLAPVHSKVVVVMVDGRPKAVIDTTTGHPTPLPDGDVAHKLPEGAKILKTTVAAHLRNLASDPNERYHAQNALQGWVGDLFVGEQLSAQEWHHPLYRHTGTEAIADFVAHFHRGYSDPDAPVLQTES